MPYIRSGANLRRQLGRLVCSVSSRASYMILLLQGLYYERSSRLMHLSRPAARMYSVSIVCAHLIFVAAAGRSFGLFVVLFQVGHGGRIKCSSAR